MRRFDALVLAVLLMLAPVVVCYADEPGAEAVDTSTAEKAATEEAGSAFDDWYGQLNIRSGVMWNVETEEWTGYATFPIIGYKSVALEGGLEIDPEQKEGPRAGVLGVTYNLGSLRSLGVDVVWADHFGLNVGPVIHYDFATGEKQFALILSVVDLSFDEGNVDRQRER